MIAKSLLVAAVSVSMAAAYSIPACWETCFEKYNIQSEGCLCSAPIESVITSCISVGCPASNATSSVGAYEGWLSSYCGTPQVTTTAVTTAYTTVCPATETSGWTTSTVSTVVSTTVPVSYTWTTPVTSTVTSTSTTVWTSGAITTSTWVPSTYVITMTPGVNTWTGTASVPNTWSAPTTTPAWTTPAVPTTTPPPYVAGAAGLKVGGVIGAVAGAAALLL